MATLERKVWDAWIAQRRERKDITFSAEQVLNFARRDADDYVSIAEARPSYMTSVEDLVAEMRSAVTEAASGLENEDALADMTVMDRANLELQLRSIADDAEQRIRSVTQSLFDRIGAPKGNRRAVVERKAPGAHARYR
jgi:hypothetical protein